MSQSASSRKSSTGGGGEKCFRCQRSTTDLDHVVRCTRCKGQAHIKCAGFDDGSFKAYAKVSHIVCFYCPSCQSLMEGLEGRLAALESKMASQTPSVDLVTEVVSKVCESIIPKISAMISEQIRDAIQTKNIQNDQMISDKVAEAVEAHGKRHNLVVVGLDEKIDTHDFVHEMCDKMKIDRGEIVDTFRDGPPREDGYSRIVKVKFRNTFSRRNFLINFHSVRGDLNAWVRPDLTYQQRLRDRELRRKLKERRDAGEEVKIFRGQIVPKH